MISQLHLIYGSIAVMYIGVAAWTFGYIRAIKSTDYWDASIGAVCFPLFFAGAFFLVPIAKMGNAFASVRQEKKDKAEAHAKKVRAELELVEQELDEELNHKAA